MNWLSVAHFKGLSLTHLLTLMKGIEAKNRYSSSPVPVVRRNRSRAWLFTPQIHSQQYIMECKYFRSLVNPLSEKRFEQIVDRREKIRFRELGSLLHAVELMVHPLLGSSDQPFSFLSEAESRGVKVRRRPKSQ